MSLKLRLKPALNSQMWMESWKIPSQIKKKKNGKRVDVMEEC